MIVRAHIEYTNSKGEERVMLSMQDNKQDAEDLLIAMQSTTEKIGSISLRNGVTLEQVQKAFPLGYDLGHKYKFAEKKAEQDPKFQGKLYEIVPV
jgi:hypothetical protein